MPLCCPERILITCQVGTCLAGQGRSHSLNSLQLTISRSQNTQLSDTGTSHSRTKRVTFLALSLDRGTSHRRLSFWTYRSQRHSQSIRSSQCLAFCVHTNIHTHTTTPAHIKHSEKQTRHQPIMDAALNQIKQLASNIDAAARQKLTLELMKVIHSLESPDDMLQRIGSLVS